MGLCPFVVFDCMATETSNSGSEFVDVLLGDSFPLDSCSFTRQWRDWDRVHLNFCSVHCPSAVCHSPKYSNHVLDGFFVPSALRFQLSDSTSSEYTICMPNKTSCAVVSHSKPNPEVVSGIHSVHGICGGPCCQRFLAEGGKYVCRFLAMQSFEWRLPVTT